MPAGPRQRSRPPIVSGAAPHARPAHGLDDADQPPVAPSAMTSSPRATRAARVRRKRTTGGSRPRRRRQNHHASPSIPASRTALQPPSVILARRDSAMLTLNHEERTGGSPGSDEAGPSPKPHPLAVIYARQKTDAGRWRPQVGNAVAAVAAAWTVRHGRQRVLVLGRAAGIVALCGLS